MKTKTKTKTKRAQKRVAACARIRVKELREEQGLTATELAIRSRIGLGEISLLERGTSTISAPTEAHALGPDQERGRGDDHGWAQHRGRRHQITEDLATAIAHALNETHRQAQAAKAREADRYRAEIAELEAKEDGIVELKLAMSLDDETFRRQLERIRSEKAIRFDVLRQSDVEIDGAYLVTARRVLELAKDAKALWDSRSPQERRDLLAKLLQNPVLDGTSVRYDLKKPFRILSEMRESKEWRGGRDSNSRPPA